MNPTAPGTNIADPDGSVAPQRPASTPTAACGSRRHFSGRSVAAYVEDRDRSRRARARACDPECNPQRHTQHHRGFASDCRGDQPRGRTQATAAEHHCRQPPRDSIEPALARMSAPARGRFDDQGGCHAAGSTAGRARAPLAVPSCTSSTSPGTGSRRRASVRPTEAAVIAAISGEKESTGQRTEFRRAAQRLLHRYRRRRRARVARRRRGRTGAPVAAGVGEQRVGVESAGASGRASPVVITGCAACCHRASSAAGTTTIVLPRSSASLRAGAFCWSQSRPACSDNAAPEFRSMTALRSGGRLA